MMKDIQCPACGRWLANAEDYVLTICAGCGAEVRYKSKEYRRRVSVDSQKAST